MSLFDISQKTILVTGGAQGLGRMMAEGLVRAGADVLITTRKEQAAVEASRQLASLGRCEALVADLDCAAGVATLVEEVKSRRGKLHVLINNAGRTWGAPLETFPDSAWESVLSVNVKAPFALVRELLPLLRSAAHADDPARIINIGSIVGLVVERIDAFSYSTSKAAIHHLTRLLAADLAADDIAVNAIAPGYFPTRMMAHIEADPDKSRMFSDRVPFGRFGKPDDVAGLCIFLASRASSYITGAIIPLDGGLTGCR